MTNLLKGHEDPTQDIINDLKNKYYYEVEETEETKETKEKQATQSEKEVGLNPDYFLGGW